jgi:hypothetical protein
VSFRTCHDTIRQHLAELHILTIQLSLCLPACLPVAALPLLLQEWAVKVFKRKYVSGDAAKIKDYSNAEVALMEVSAERGCNSQQLELPPQNNEDPVPAACLLHLSALALLLLLLVLLLLNASFMNAAATPPG